MRVVLWSCLGAFAFHSGFLTATELSFGAELDGNSRYVWRGLALSVILDRELRDAVSSPLLVTAGLMVGKEF
jgi:hypothetical protein